ncbi:uncharacterized protein TNIN_500181 [Trichonephila inaurata madagascariensis]|uniref:Uncharacterized protein n=1 Tax=Trichonephila inaurata madagascariensis TaxID=2747483 RepID=A0A8X6XUL9_9ARAC|nr:uncharacterized protein TNIN_500181 [Trichonephila inaurata madagascariensis]
MLVTIVPSLQHLAIVKIAVCVYTSPEVRKFEKNMMGCFGFSEIHEREWISFIRERVSHCALQEKFQKKVIDFMKPLSLELCLWHTHLNKMFVFHAPTITPVWNSAGTIDQLRTARKLVHCQDLPFLERFSLACHFWMTDDVLEIWKETPLQEREKAIQNMRRNEFSLFMNEKVRKLRKEFLNKWIEWMDEGAVDHEQYYFYCFSLFSMPYLPMQSYLLKKASPQATLDALRDRLRSNPRLNDLEYACLLNLDVNYQEELRKTEPYGLLMAFLHHPLQNHFLKMAELVGDYLKEEEFDNLLFSIFLKLREGWKDYDYRDLLKNFFFRSPMEFRMLDKKSAFFRSFASILSEYLE